MPDTQESKTHNSSRFRRGPNAVVTSLWIIFVLSVLGCSNSTQNEIPFKNTFSSPHAIVESVLPLIVSGNADRLESLLLTHAEHDSALVPLMAGKDSVHIEPLGWFLLSSSRLKGIRRAIRDYGDNTYLELVSIKFLGEEQHYGPLTLHREPQVMVLNQDGEKFVLPVFGTFLEYSGRFKLISFKD